MEKIPILIKKWRSDAILPRFATSGDAGADCFINRFKSIINSSEKKAKELEDKEYALKPLERIGCCLGFATVIPTGYYCAVVPRSGLAFWDGLSIVNTPGTIDAGYRNEWMAIIINFSDKIKILKKNDKICQFIIRKLENVELKEVEELSSSERGLNGFGSTGT